MVHAPCVSDIRFASVRNRFDRIQRLGSLRSPSGIPSATAVAEAAAAAKVRRDAASKATAANKVKAVKAVKAAKAKADAMHAVFLDDLATLLRVYATAPFHTVAGSVKVYMDDMSMSIGRISMGNHWLKCIIRRNKEVITTAIIRNVEEVVGILKERKCCNTNKYIEVRDFTLLRTKFALCASMTRPGVLSAELVALVKLSEYVGVLYHIEEVLSSEGACERSVAIVENEAFPVLRTMPCADKRNFLIGKQNVIREHIAVAISCSSISNTFFARDMIHMINAKVDAAVMAVVDGLM
jgi:hypothetical protein